MTELREFGRHSNDLDTLHVQFVPISVDDQQHAHQVREKVGDKRFMSLSHRSATVISKFCLLHERKVGPGGTNIALRTTLLIGPDGRERWRHVSHSVPDIVGWNEMMAETGR